MDNVRNHQTDDCEVIIERVRPAQPPHQPEVDQVKQLRMDDEGCREVSCITPKAWVPGQIKLLLSLVLLV